MSRVALEATRQTRWLALCQTESVGRDGCRIARLEGVEEVQADWLAGWHGTLATA